MTPSLKHMLCSVAAIAILSACGGQAETPLAQTPEPAVMLIPKGQLPEGVTPTAYRVDLVTNPADASYSGRVEIDVQLDAPTDVIFLHALGPDVTSAAALTANGLSVDASFEGDLAPGGVSRLAFATPLPAGIATLQIDFTAPYNLGLAGLYKASQAGRDYLATQMEPIDARRAFPSFDEPRFKTPWTMTVTAPAENAVIANGAEKAATVLENGWVRHEFATTRPIQSYLVALAVGPYESLTTQPIPANAIRPEAVPFRSWAAAGKGDQLETAHASTFELLRIQEEYFNYPYPYGKLDLIAVPDFAYGAMENAGAIIYRESALLIDARTSLGAQRGVLTTHAHELAHQWFGNLVTPKWWDDIWLNEAFATWMSYRTMHAYDPEGGFDRSAIQSGIGAMGADGLASARQIRNPINANGDILSAFDGITYSKGGHVLSMFENYLGEDAFREGIRLHMTRFEDGVADVNDFMTSLSEGSGNAGVVESFKTFIFQPGVPFLEVNVSCQDNSDGRVTISQSRYAPLGSTIDANQTWQVPFAMRVASRAGDVTHTALLTDKATDIAVSGCPSFVMPNAGGAGYWRFTTSDDNWKALTENFDKLTGGEQMMFADSLVAGFNAGKVSAEAMLAGLAVTPYGEWDAASLPLGRLAALTGLLDEADQDLMRARLSATYRPVYDALVARNDLSQGETLFKEALYRTLVGVVEDPALRADLKTRAEQYVGLNGAPDASALPASQLGAGMLVGVEEGGTAFFKAALAFAKTTDNQRDRRAIFNILAGGGSLEDVTGLLDAAFGDDFQGQEALFMHYAALGHDDDAIVDMGWTRFQRDFEKLLARVPEIRKPQMASVAGSFCDNAKTDAAEAFVKSKADLIPGYERPLAQAVESARLCAALTEAKKDELAAALK